MLETDQPDSLRSMFQAAHRNASLVRDRLSLDSWRVLHRVHREFAAGDDPGQRLDQVVGHLLLLCEAFEPAFDVASQRPGQRLECRRNSLFGGRSHCPPC